jgi:hypothetical protein
MKAELKTITPEWASKILAEKNGGNRAINEAHVARLAKEIKAGRWKVNGDTICLNGERLIDGQHRLAAVVKSGIAIQSFVIDGLPSDVFDTKDVGKKRSASDTLGVNGEINTRRLAAALVLIDRYCTGRMLKSVEYSNAEIEELLEKHPDVRKSVSMGHAVKLLIVPSVLDACHYLFSRKDQALADEFVDKVLRGAGLEPENPWYLLRERLVSNSLSKAKLPKTHVMALCIKAWNATRTGAPIKQLRWFDNGANAEQFPLIR